MGYVFAAILSLVAIGSIWKFLDANRRAIILIAAPIFLLLIVVKLLKRKKEKMIVENTIETASEIQNQAEAEILEAETNNKNEQIVDDSALSSCNAEGNFVDIPFEINGCPCAYSYEKVYFDLIPDVDPNQYIGRKVRFDDYNGEISVKVGKKQIGTMRDNRLSDMVSDWLDREEPIYAVITHTNDDPPECAFDLFFYRKEKDDEY